MNEKRYGELEMVAFRAAHQGVDTPISFDDSEAEWRL
jgi:hypothetical protein